MLHALLSDVLLFVASALCSVLPTQNSMRKQRTRPEPDHAVRLNSLELTFKDPPPPYEENDDQAVYEELDTSIVLPSDALDLLANCKVSNADDQQTDVEYTEIQNMGIWHSTPLAHRHKSKISLTWVLKENLESTKLHDKKLKNDERLKTVKTDDRYVRNLNERDGHRKCKSGEVRERVVGRNEYYHNLRFRSAYEEFGNDRESWSDTTIGTEEYNRRKHRHRHRRKKRNTSRFGYDIRDLDSFLSEASIDRPGNIPVVIAYPTALYQTHKDLQQELPLPLGTVVNAVFKNQQWLYAQTPHGDEGYVMYSACLPLGILPSKTPQKKTPCWESSTDIYPRPCGNLTDTEKEQLRGRTRSESRYKTHEKKVKNCAEKNFDNLYLKTKSATDVSRIGKENSEVKRQTLLVVNSDYKGSAVNKTLTVEQGEVVVLVRKRSEEFNKEWFYVRKRDGSQGYIPAAVAGHGYI